MHKELKIRSCGVSVAVVRKHGKTHQTLMLMRTNNKQWSQIAGGIELGEKAWEAALREIKEETGIVPEQLYSADTCEQFYELEKDSIWIAPVFVAFAKPNSNVVLNHEHSEYKWVSFKEAISMVPFPGQKAILKYINDEFVKKHPVELLKIK
jgi:dihydroneopterin triphosphate diphosphatase